MPCCVVQAPIETRLSHRTEGTGSAELPPLSACRGRERAALVFLLCVAMVLRYLYTAHNFVVTPDSVEFLETAAQVEEQGLSAVRSSLRQPLYPLALWVAGKGAALLSPDFSWRGREMADAGRFLGIAIYPAFLIAAWVFFRRVGGRTVGLLCLLAVIVHPLFGFYFANVMSETLYLVFFLAGLTLLLKAADDETKPRHVLFSAFFCGCSAALAYMTRVEGQLLAIGGIIYFVAQVPRVGREGAGRTKLLSNAALIFAGYLALALPLMLFLGRSSQRYSWEWLWEKILAPATSSGAAAAGVIAAAALMVSPVTAVWMLVREFITRAPETIVLATMAFGRALMGSQRSSRQDPLNTAYGPIGTVMAIYALAIIAGVSIQNGVVSQRYIQPLVLMAMPAAALFAASVVAKRAGRIDGRLARWVAAGAATAALLAAGAVACHRWGAYKVGYRDAGAAIRAKSAAGAKVLTSELRVAFYAGARSAVTPEQLKNYVLSGRTTDYDFVVVESKRLADGDLAAMEAALARQGFDPGRRLEFAQDGDNDQTTARVLLYVRESP